MAARSHPTTHSYVVDAVRARIAAGELLPGQRVRQEELAEALGVSPVPVREALRMLEGEGRLVHRPQRGYVVAELPLDELEEVYRLRQLLESEALRAGAESFDGERLALLRTLAREVEAESGAGRMSEALTANRRFHFELLAPGAGPVLRRHLQLLWDATEAYRARYYGEPPNLRRVHREHQAMLEAVSAGDTDRLVELLDAHRLAAITRLRQLLADAG